MGKRAGPESPSSPSPSEIGTSAGVSSAAAVSSGSQLMADISALLRQELSCTNKAIANVQSSVDTQSAKLLEVEGRVDALTAKSEEEMAALRAEFDAKIAECAKQKACDERMEVELARLELDFQANLQQIEERMLAETRRLESKLGAH